MGSGEMSITKVPSLHCDSEQDLQKGIYLHTITVNISSTTKMNFKVTAG